MATEEAKYTVIRKDGDIEIRQYESQIVAETAVQASLEDAGNLAFRRLFRYISGANKAKTKIAMTAPVGQAADSRKIDMTAPVSQQAGETGDVVSFMMPASYTMETIPDPTDDAVSLRQIPPRRVAAIRYSGRWSEARYEAHKARLDAWIRKENLAPNGKAIWARYNPPFMPWFLRRNEILIPLAGSDASASAP
jgi:hypothetical protein